MTEITHERCSELLAGHNRGELGREDAAAVEHHLAGCEDCRAELAGLRALTAAPEFEPLRDDERTDLRDAVLREARLAPAHVYELPARRTFWERHAGQIVGAAASIVAILFAVLVFQGLGGGDDAGGGGGDAQVGAEGGDAAVEPEALAAPEGPLPVFASPEAVATHTATTEDEDSAESGSARPLSRIEARRAYTEDSITKLGASGRIFRDFMEAYTVDDAAALADSFLERLASEAPSAQVAQQIRDCRRALPADDPASPLLPAYAAVADFNGEGALVLGFVEPDAATAELGRYSIVVWPLGDCSTFRFSGSGEINPGP